MSPYEVPTYLSSRYSFHVYSTAFPSRALHRRDPQLQLTHFKAQGMYAYKQLQKAAGFDDLVVCGAVRLLVRYLYQRNGTIVPKKKREKLAIRSGLDHSLILPIEDFVFPSSVVPPPQLFRS